MTCLSVLSSTHQFYSFILMCGHFTHSKRRKKERFLKKKDGGGGVGRRGKQAAHLLEVECVHVYAFILISNNIFLQF